MKKAITTILSVLLLVSCLTVNVFADETDTGNLLAETTDELNALEEISEVEREDTVKDDSVITVNDDKALNVYHMEQNGTDEWTFIISLIDYYSDQPLTATVKCGSEVRFSQFMEDGSQIDSFTRLESGDVIMTLPKNGRTRIVLGDGDNAKEHLVSVECDYEQIIECSYFDGIEIDDSFGFMFVMNDSQYNSEAKFFDTLTMTLIVDKSTHQSILNAINSGSNTDLVEDFYTIYFKYDTLISKDFGVDVIDGFDIPYVLYQVSYEGVTENIIIYFDCNDNGDDGNKEPVITEGILVMGSTEIPLRRNYKNNRNIFEWTVDFNTFDEDLEKYYWSYINSSSPVKIKYKTGNNDDYVTIDDNSFVIGVIDELDIYTKYATYTDDETGQKHIFYLEPTTRVIDLDDVDEIKVSLNGNEKAISLDSYDEVEGRRFYKPSEGFNFVDSAVFALTINIRNKEPLTFTYEDLRKDTINYSGTEVNIQGAKFYSKNDNCFIYFCSNYEIIDSTSGSFIKPFDNGGYWVNKRGDNEYAWTFNVDIEQFYNGNTVLLMKNNTAGSIDFAQTQQSINQSGLAEIKKVNGGFSIKPVFGSDLVFTATSNGVNQTHIICIQFDKNSILNKTGIKSVGITDGFYNFMTNESIYNLNKGMFDSVAISANMPVYKLNQFILDVSGGQNVNLSEYLQLSFKGNYNMNNNPTCIVLNGSFGKMVKVSFEISDGNNTETVVVYCQRKVDDQDQTKIRIDGKEFYQETFGDTLIYLPVQNGSLLEFDYSEIVNAVNSSTAHHKVVIVDYSIDFLNNGFNSSQRNIVYVDGYEMEESVRISLDLYYLDNPEVLNNGNLSKQKDLTRVGDSFNGPVNTSFLLDTFDNYTGALEHRLKTEREMPYKTGSNSVPRPPVLSADELASGESVGVWISYDNTTSNDEIYFYRNMRFTGPESVTYFNIAGNDNGIRDYDRVIYVGGDDNTQYPATADGLEKAVKDLNNSGRSSVILMENIALGRDIFLKHNNNYSDNPDSNPKADLEINLNGHSINVQGNTIVNLRHSAIHFTNYRVENGKSGTALNNTTAVISGNGNEPVIENYGNLYIFDKVNISNLSGTAILTYNSGGLYLSQQTNINAGICIDIQENEIMADGRDSSTVVVNGNLSAEVIAIKTTTINSEIKNVISISNKNKDSNTTDYTYQTITSKNIGILSVGNVQIETYGYEITASEPFVISGGSLEIRKTTVRSADINSNDVATTNSNPVILIDSDNPNATNTTLLIATENNVNMKTNGALIKEKASKYSKIDKIYFYSINSRDDSFFDYTQLFSFDKPVTNAYIHINGGCFKDRTFESYLLNTPKSIVEYTDANNVKYYYNNKNCFREVDNFNDLKDALENQDVQDIKLTGNIVASRNDTTVTFEVNGPKVLFLNGHTIENVHFVANTTKFNSPKAFFSIQNSNDSNSNIAAGKLLNTGTVLETKTTNLYINDVDVESTDDIAIKIYGGRASIRGKNNKISITGTNAIMLDNTASNMNMGNLDIEYSNVIGTSGPAINVVKTNATTYIHIFNQSLVKSDYLNQNDLNNSSAIKISDRAKVMMENSEISGKKYGIYFADGLSAQGFVNYYAGVSFGKGSVLKGDIALRLGDYTTAFMNDATIIATSKVMEIHGFTQYMIGSGDYKATDKNGKIIDFVGSNSSAHTHWHVITGGYYSHCVEDNAIFNNPASNYLYKCLPVDTTDNKNPEPWKVVIKEKYLKSYQSLEVPSERDVIIDNTRLENAFDKNELPDGVSYDVVLTVKFKNDTETKNKFDGHENGFKEYYDIHVDKSLNNVVITGVDETKNYQLISIPLNKFKYENDDISYSDVNNIKVHHNHKEGNNSVTYQLKKITKNQAKNAKEECYYLDEVNGQWYLNIITRRFSDFAIQDTGESIVTQELKPDYPLTLNYQELYSSVNQVPPDTATYNGTNSISKEKVDIVYYNINGSEHYYSSEFPTTTGEYAVEWTVKESENFTGKGVAQFKVLDVDLNNIQLKQDLVFTGKPQQLIEDITNIDDYSFVVEDYQGYIHKFPDGAPTMTNAGKYKVYFSKNGYVEYKGEAEISKANPVAPEKLYGTYGNRLSTVSLEDFSGWKWEKPNLFISNVGTLYYWASFKETDNYKSARANVLVEVSKKQAPNPQLPKVGNVVYGTTLGDIKLTGTWKWVNETIVPDVKNNGYQAYIIVDDTRFDWSKHTQYNPKDHSYVVTLKPNVSKADITLDKSSIPTFYNVKKGTLLSELGFASSSGWNWVNPKDAVGGSNYAVYNPDRNNYNDLLVSIPVYIKETVAGKEISISNTVSSNDEKGIKEVTVANDAISNSVVDVVAKAEESETKVSKEVTDFINSSVSNSLTITTELVKKTVNDESKKQEAIEQANVKTGEVAMVLDLEIKIKVDNGTESKEGKVTELSEPVKLTFKLPKGSKVTASEGKELKYYVLVIHEGEVHKIPAVLNADGTVTFETDKFSTYILVSEEVAKPVVENSTPSYVPSQNKKPVVNTSAK